MKKIIALLFFAGFLTTSFAQSGHRQKNDNQGDENVRIGNNNYGDANKTYNEGYSDNQWSNRGNQNGSGRYSDRDNRDRDNGDRYNEWGNQYNNCSGYSDDSYRNRHRRIFYFRMFHHDRD